MADSRITLREALRGPWIWIALACLPAAAYIPLCLSRRGYHIPVGVYIGIMGLLAAAVTLRDKQSVYEKAVWILVLTCLMGAEIRNLYTADKEQAATFGSISDSLKATKVGLEAAANRLNGISGDINDAAGESKNQFSETMSKVGRLTSLTSQNLEQLTGGDEYAYVIVGPPMTGEWPLLAVNSGKIPLRSVQILIEQIFSTADPVADYQNQLKSGRYVSLDVLHKYDTVQLWCGGSPCYIQGGTYHFEIMTLYSRFSEIITVTDPKGPNLRSEYKVFNEKAEIVYQSPPSPTKKRAPKH